MNILQVLTIRRNNHVGQISFPIRLSTGLGKQSTAGVTAFKLRSTEYHLFIYALCSSCSIRSRENPAKAGMQSCSC
ncbi:hypothetical protein VTN31DRAFT_6376 [Thermomyces dupontii]|uniref:uncharacterized protein n=1 Tax=Talaromyces thermophilus TaxID=28565 RepID=UPI003742AA8C